MLLSSVCCPARPSHSDSPFWEGSPLLFFLSFGAHSFRSVLPILQVYFLDTNFVTSTGYALLLVSQSLPALVLPFFVGHIFDSFEFKYVTVSFLIIQMTGQLSFCFSLYVNNFPFAILSLVLFGSGSSAVSVAQRALVVDHYRGSESFGIGCIHCVSSFSKFIGKVSIIPAVLWFQSYKVALLSMCMYTLLSLAIACYLLCGLNAPSYHTHDPTVVENKHQLELEMGPVGRGATDTCSESGSGAGEQETDPDNDIREPLRSRTNSTSIEAFGFWKSLFDKRVHLTSFFMLLASAHTVYLLVFHLLGNFLPHILLTHWHMTFALAGVASSLLSLLPAVLSPCLGLLVDRSGLQLQACLVAALASSLAYALLLLAPAVTPFLPILLLSLGTTLIPTITLALVPHCIPTDAYGLAYGSMEVVDSLGLMTGNYVFGVLYKRTLSYVPGMTGLAVLSGLGTAIFVVLLCLQRGRRREGRHSYTSIPSKPVPLSSPLSVR